MKKWTVLIILAVSQFVMILDGTVMNVSISTVAKDLDTTISGMQAAITFFTLTMAALMLTGGKLGDIWGRRRAFKIGAVIYGIGSLITALSVSLGMLMFGWSLVEGLGAILVIPAIASLTAVNYKGKDRVVAFSIIGAVTGLAAAVGPIIGGFMTTYLSWRYVFGTETIIMAGVLLVANKIDDEKSVAKPHLDIPSVFLSAIGMGLLVLGVLQSKTWGWVEPRVVPNINGHEIAPLGISIVAYLVIAGVVLLWLFYGRQKALAQAGRDALLKVSMLSISALRSGLNVILGQYFIVAGLFFIIPVYLQVILGYDALKTGIKLIPMSIGMVLFSAVGTRLSGKKATRRITRVGQLSMGFGALLVMGSVEPNLKGGFFWAGMFILGSGFGLLASQIGNSNMSVVDKEDTSEVGGLQGTFQCFGQSLGTALVGSIFILALSSGFASSVQSNPNLSQDTKNQITTTAQTSVPIVSPAQAQQMVIAAGGSQSSAETVSSDYANAQIKALKKAMFFIFAMAILSLLLSRNLSKELEPA
ncbi:MAG TPA: MFS transporter [Candidatus Binatia bacterium]|nr:MFS transporter [Candidatus Binatia bacterium]